MGLFDMFKINKMPHHLGLITLYKDTVYWVDDILELKYIPDIQLERGDLYGFCCVLIIKSYETFWFGIRNKSNISQEFLEEYYQSILQIIQTHYDVTYDSAYTYLKGRDNEYRGLFEQSLIAQDWSIIIDKFIYNYTKLDGLIEQRQRLLCEIKNKSNEHLHYMNNNFK